MSKRRRIRDKVFIRGTDIEIDTQGYGEGHSWFEAQVAAGRKANGAIPVYIAIADMEFRDE